MSKQSLIIIGLVAGMITGGILGAHVQRKADQASMSAVKQLGPNHNNGQPLRISSLPPSMGSK